MTETLQTWLASAMASDIFAGGLALGAIGMTVAFGRMVVGAICRLLSRRLWAQLALDNRSTAYRHLSLWMEANGVLAHVRQVRLTDTRRNAGTAMPPPPESTGSSCRAISPALRARSTKRPGSAVPMNSARWKHWKSACSSAASPR
ncbi:hypothetical protein [Paenirhodobacter populi]|uniref:BCS1 N-terminal domain-containing protein n=1 Tax=Paenirhodobacter populi TaxID=2306993 RepID=A0A443INP7_9RHOB|nr:hypothetical protein [Sinirhodobacter populi]RWR07036.1 hypothetical protein D2T33_17835 [Sinirhodobacter populi]